MIRDHLQFFSLEGDNLIGYQITGSANGDSWSDILVFFNGNKDDVSVEVPEGNYTKVIANHQIDEKGLGDVQGGEVTVKGRSALVLVKGTSAP